MIAEIIPLDDRPGADESGIIGPRGDGYVADALSSAADAAAYHLPQAMALKKGGVNMLSAVTLTTSAEAMGVARSAKAVGLPVAISFTVASTRSHAELDAATKLDIGDPADLGERYRRLCMPLPALNVLGGCCGIDNRHLRAIRDAWVQHDQM